MTGAAPVDFVVVGAQKGGSTHLADCLGDHPDVYVCPDEVPYFEDPFYATRDPHELARAVAAGMPGQRRGIHRPEYLAEPAVAGRLAADLPGVRVLAVLREPVARAISAYSWYVQFGLLPLAPLAEGLARLLDGWTDPGYPRAADVLGYGRYGEQLERYVSAVGRDRMLVLLNEDLRDPAVFEDVYRFVGVDPSHRPRMAAERTNPGVYEPRRLRFLRARRRFAWSWEGQPTYRFAPRRRRKPLGALVAAGFVATDRFVLARLLGDPRPNVPPDLRARLHAHFADDLDAVETVLARPLPPPWRP